MLTQIHEAANYIQSKITFTPQVGIILGTGLGSLATQIETIATISYQDIPYFPVSTVESHSGRLLLGKLSGKYVVVMQGRFHYYEGYTMQQVTFPVRVMKVLGIQQLIVSNASGGLNPAYNVSELMLIEDHLNLLPENPLTGRNLDELGVRFPDMSEPYDLAMLETAEAIAQENQIKVHRGVYASVSGPNLETKAEYKFLRIIGADAVGMSTVPEVIVARQMDLPCFGISVITDLGIPEKLKRVTLEEVIAAAMKAEPNMTLIIRELVARL